jgi:Domain of unknown function (DUF4175)
MLDPVVNIQRYLEKVRKRMGFLHLVRDLGLLLSVSALLLLLFLILASAVDHLVSLRFLGGAMILIIGAGFMLHFVLALRRLGHEQVVAKIIGAKIPRLRSDLISTVELREGLDLGSQRFSSSLYQALVRQTWRRLRRVPITALVSTRALTPVAIVLSVCVLTWAAAAATMSDRVGRGATRLLAPSLGGGAEVAEKLLIGDVKLSYRYPKHMGRPDQLVQSSTGHITAPRGTRVDIKASSVVPITQANLVLSWRGNTGAPSRLRLKLKDQRELRGTLVVAGDGAYRFEAQTPGGRRVLNPPRHRITLEPDATPRVVLYGPKDGLEITAEHQLELGFTAEDDYGLRRVELVYQVASAPPQRVSLWRPKRGQRTRSASAKRDWNLQTIDLFPGADVSYWIEAQDNDSVSGPKTGRSKTLRFSVYSPEKNHQKTLSQQQRMVEQGLRILADRLLLFAAKPCLSPGLQVDKGQGIHRASGGLVDGLRELRNLMRKDKLVSKAQARTIGKMHQRLRALLNAEAGQLKVAIAAKRRQQIRASRLTPLRDHNRKLVAEMERDVLLLANTLDEQRLQSLMTLGRRLQQARKRLAKLIKRYRKTRDEKLRREIMRQIRRMQQEMTQLLAQIAKLNTSIPDEYLNKEALASFDLRQDLNKLSSMLKSGKLSELEAAMRALDRKLEQIQGLLAGNLQQFRQGRMSAQERAYSKMLDRLRGMENEQRAIARRTGQVIRRYHQRAAKLMKHRINPFVRRELKKLARLRKRVYEIDRANLAPYDQEQLSRIKQRIKDLKGMLDQGDLDEALRMAMRTRNGLQILQDDLAEELEGRYVRRHRGRKQKTSRRVQASRRLAEELVADLKGIFPHPRTLLDRKDRATLRQLQRRQQELRSKAAQLQAKLARKAGKGGPGAGLPQGLREAGSMMGQSREKLRKLQPQEAHGSQEGAADRLARLRKQAQASRQPQQWSRSGRSVMRRRVNIPGADAFRPPREFRQDLMEAMKEKAPESYQQQVKRYYKGLVR